MKKRRQHLSLGQASHHYGGTRDEHKAVFDGKCRICSEILTWEWVKGQEAKWANLDHCHTSGQFRGWLCTTCNTALGMAKDSPELLRAMAEYIDNHRKSSSWWKRFTKG